MTTLGELLNLIDMDRDSDEIVEIMDGSKVTMRGLTRSALWAPHEKRIVSDIRARDDVLQVWLKEGKA